MQQLEDQFEEIVLQVRRCQLTLTEKLASLNREFSDKQRAKVQALCEEILESTREELEKLERERLIISEDLFVQYEQLSRFE